MKAKNHGKHNKKNSLEKDILDQLEKNNRRLDVLKHEMQKRKIQLQTIQNAPTVPLPLALKKSALNKNTGNSLEREGKKDSQDTSLLDTGILRVVVVDPATKAEVKKAIYITENQSTVEVIEMILNKANLSGLPNEFQLSYKTPSQGIKNY